MLIRLTASDDDVIYINADSIEMMYRKQDGLTHVQIVKENSGGYAVKETPEQIMEIIKNVRN